MLLAPNETTPESAAAVPLALRIEWDGPACNPDGNIRAIVRNVGDKELALPRNGGLGFGSLFTARILVKGKVTRTIGDGYNIPYLLEAMKKEDVVLLQKGEEFSYQLTLRYKHPLPLDKFSHEYNSYNERGGRLGLIYNIINFGKSGQYIYPFYFVRYDLDPFITSNTLICVKK